MVSKLERTEYILKYKVKNGYLIIYWSNVAMCETKMARIESKIKINGLLKPNSVIRDPCIETLTRLANRQQASCRKIVCFKELCVQFYVKRKLTPNSPKHSNFALPTQCMITIYIW